MTQASARLVANAALGLAAAGAAYVVWRNPRLRLIAVQLLKTAVTTTLPAYLWKEINDAWEETGRRQSERRRFQRSAS